MIPRAGARYAVRALAVLSEGYPNRRLSIREIAEREGVSEKYLEPLFARLKRAELVVSVRGQGGGYRLLRDPTELTLYEVFTALGTTPLQEFEAGTEGRSGSRTESGGEMDPVWDGLRERVVDYLRSITIADARALWERGRASENYRI